MTLPSIPTPFLYNATVLLWHDGDTGWFELDRGVYEYARWDIRLLGCNATELAAPGGKEARDNLTALLPPGSKVVLGTAKPDKFGGRLDASVTYLGADGQPHDLVTDLAAQQWVALWDGKGTKPVPPWPRTVAGKRTPAEYVARARQRMLDAGEDPDRPVFACDPPAESTIGQQIEQSQEYARRAYGSGTEQ